MSAPLSSIEFLEIPVEACSLDADTPAESSGCTADSPVHLRLLAMSLHE